MPKETHMEDQNRVDELSKDLLLNIKQSKRWFPQLIEVLRVGKGVTHSLKNPINPKKVVKPVVVIPIIKRDTVMMTAR